MQIAIVTPSSVGPVVYFLDSVEDALAVISAWALGDVAGVHSISKMVAGEWVPFAQWINERRMK